VKYAADWNSIKFAAAFGYSNITDEGCSSAGSGSSSSTNPTGRAGCGLVLQGGGGAPFQDFKRDVDVWQVGASIMHVPSGLWAYGLWQEEDNNGTQWKELNFNHPVNSNGTLNARDSNANQTDVWFTKAGIKRTWTPLGATVIWGEGGQYHNMYSGICGNPQGETNSGSVNPSTFCASNLPTGQFDNKGRNLTQSVFVTGTEVNRWGAGVMQEIDSAAMHVWFNWQHLEVNLDAVSACESPFDSGDICTQRFGRKVNQSYQDLDIFMLGGVIFF
jgi:hypothetical protein